MDVLSALLLVTLVPCSITEDVQSAAPTQTPTLSPSPTPPACPKGCRCMERDGFATVFCMNSGLTDIPTPLSPSTRQLYMQGHTLGTVRNRAFSSVPELRTLVLEDCGIHTLQPGAFAGLANLTNLNLKRNDIQELRQGMFAGIGSIHEINLDGNDLRSIDEFTFDGLSNELILRLENNVNLKDVSAKAFKGAAIKELYFYNASLSDESLECITPLKSVLSVFFLSTNRVPLNIPYHLFKGFFFLNLNLADNGLTDVAFLRNVRADDISLEYNNIGTLNMAEFPNLKQTRILHLSHTSSRSLDGSFFEGLTSLTQIHLSHNLITTLPENLQSVFTGLERVSLEGNPIHCNCEIEWFHRWFPLYSHVVTPPTCESPQQHTAIADLTEEDLQCTAPSSLTIKEKVDDKHFTLLCSARGDPAPTISWRIPDGSLYQSTDPNPAERDAQETESAVQVRAEGGTYTCLAHNIKGNLSREITVPAYHERSANTATTTSIRIFHTYLFLVITSSISCLLF